MAQASVFSYRRYQLGPRPLANLFHRVCRPLATPTTTGAFLGGLRLMAIDGTVEAVPDTPANVAVFGRHPGDRGDGAFPQVQAVYLVKCGTHAIVDAGFWPCQTSERIGGFWMLRSLTPDMLIMWDRGFHDFDMFQGVLRRHGHALGRLPAHVNPKHVRNLTDGSYPAYIYPADYHRRKRGEHLLLRIIEYTIRTPHCRATVKSIGWQPPCWTTGAGPPSTWRAGITNGGRLNWSLMKSTITNVWPAAPCAV